MAKKARKPTPPRRAAPPRASKSTKDWLGKLRGSLKEARQILEADKRAREAADRAPNSIILSPEMVAGGKWDAAKVLHTTLGGQRRSLTPDDLAAFRHNIRLLQGRLGRGGITARQVIDLSGSYLAPGVGTDRQRAQREIHHAIPAGFNRGELHVITDAGGQTPHVTRHHVLIQFPLFDVAVNDANLTPKQAAQWLLKQPLKYDCDCGRHRFFFRFVSTSGNFNAGRPEHGYPKIRNPQLIGVACKHVIRVMTEVDGLNSRFVSILERAIKQDRDRDAKKRRIETTQAEGERIAQQSARPIRSSIDIQMRQAQARSRAAVRAASRQAPAPRKRTILQRAQDAIVGTAEKFGITRNLASKIINFFRKP